MEDKLQKLVEEFKEIDQKLMDPDIVSNQAEYKKIMIRRSELDPLFKLLLNTQTQRQTCEAKALVDSESDSEMKEFIKTKSKFSNYRRSRRRTETSVSTKRP